MTYDLAVIGGGPAGMMAAGRAGELGARVVVVEKNHKLGVKLLATGGGRCNLTNQAVNQKEFIASFGKSGKFLHSALNQFGPDEARSFFGRLGVPTKIEADNRVFPSSDKASDILNALLGYLDSNMVERLTKATVGKIIRQNQKIKKIILTDGREVVAKNFVIATGGKSYPETGSTGDGYQWLKNLGHTIVQPRPALASLVVKEWLAKELEGVSLENIKIAVYQQERKLASRQGEIVFTLDGISGPVIFNLSSVVGSVLPEQVSLALDFFPDHSSEQLDKLVCQAFHQGKNKLIKNCLVGWMPMRLFLTLIKSSELDPDQRVNSVSRQERRLLVQKLKKFNLTATGLSGGFAKAMITAGGVALAEVDPQTMKSKIIDNLYLAGEILDLDGPTGGYNLQVAWSTGYLSGQNVVSRKV